VKPYVICHMASSIDGRILPQRWRPRGLRGDLHERLHEQLAGQAWLVGRVTGQEFARAERYPDDVEASFPRDAWFAQGDASAYGVVPDAEGKVAGGGARKSEEIRSSWCSRSKSRTHTWRDSARTGYPTSSLAEGASTCAVR